MPTQTSRLNLTKPDLGKKPWKTEGDQWADKIDAIAAQILPLHICGQAIDEEVVLDGHRFKEEVNIVGVSIHARVAPVGQSLSIAFLKDQVQADSAALPDGSRSVIVTLSPEINYKTTEDFGIKVTNVGSTEPGSEIDFYIHYHVPAIPA